jgi:hypothetical protein
MEFLITQFSSVSCYFIPLRSKHNPLNSILKKKNLSACSSFNVRDQVSHPQETTGKITPPYNSILVFTDQEGKQKIMN